MCCQEQKVRLRIRLDPLEPLNSLLTEESSRPRHFRRNIRKYKFALTMASMEAKADMRFSHGPITGGPHQCCVFGNVYHGLGPLTPGEGYTPTFAQVYLLEMEDQHRVGKGSALALYLRSDILQELGAILMTQKACAQVFQPAASLDCPDVTSLLRCGSNVDPPTCNVPRVSEVTAFIYEFLCCNPSLAITGHMRPGGPTRPTAGSIFFERNLRTKIISSNEEDFFSTVRTPLGWPFCCKHCDKMLNTGILKGLVLWIQPATT